jgi:NADH dehydrogenase FAD-containing subunit
MSARCHAEFKRHDIELITSTRVTSPEDTTLEPTTVKLSNGESFKDVLYISAAGGYKPNASFLPDRFLSDDGHIEILPTLQTVTDPVIFALGGLRLFLRSC